MPAALGSNWDVDYETLERTPKDSAKFYADVIKTNGAALAGGD